MKYAHILLIWALLLGEGIAAAPAIRARSGSSAPQKPIVAARAGAIGPGVINNSTKVQIAAAGPVSEECQTAWWGCMDAFCMPDNDSGARCNCHNDKSKYDKQLEEIEKNDSESSAVMNRASDRIRAGSRAEIVVEETATQKRKRNQAATLAMFSAPAETKKELKGASLAMDSENNCAAQMPANCNLDLLKSMYRKNITDDCAAYAKFIKDRKNQSQILALENRSALRNVALETFDSTNKFDRGQCITAMRDCMRGEDVCGKDWTKCAGEDLNEKKYICESVLQNCAAVADSVWDGFVALVKNDLAAAADTAYSNQSQRCLGDLSDCIARACKDDIAGRGGATYDACLSRPEMAQSFCKVQFDRCAHIPNIWDYTKARLASMRIDACTAEVKECFTSEDRCGADWLQCIGLDYASMHDLCPVDKLVVCKKANPKFSMSDVDDIVRGIYLAMDNAMVDECERLATEHMLETCGSLTDCDAIFAEEENMGAMSLAKDKSGAAVMLTGLINWPLLKHDKGEIDTAGYLQKVRANARDANSLARVQNELKNVSDVVARTIKRLEHGNTDLAQCIGGRDMTQVQGAKARATTGRFPHLMERYFPFVAQSALNSATLNYAIRYNEMKAEIIQESDLLNAEYECYAAPIEADKRMTSYGMAKENSQKYELRARGGYSEQGGEYSLSEIVADSVDVSDITKIAGTHVKNEAQIANGGEMKVRYDISTAFAQATRTCRTCTETSICTAREFNGDGTGAGLKNMLKTIAISCAMGAVTQGIANAVQGAAQASKAATDAAKVADSAAKIADNAAKAADVAEKAVNTVTTVEKAGNAAGFTLKATKVGEKAANTAKMFAETTKATAALKAADATAKAAKVAQIARNTSIAVSATSGVVGAGIGAADLGKTDDRTMGQQIGWMAAEMAVGAVVGQVCARLVTAVPIGTIAVAAIIVLSAVASSVINDKNFSIECEVLEPQCEERQL